MDSVDRVNNHKNINAAMPILLTLHMKLRRMDTWIFYRNCCYYINHFSHLRVFIFSNTNFILFFMNIIES